MSRHARWRLLAGIAIGLAALALRLGHVLSTGQAVAVGLCGEALDWAFVLFGVRAGIRSYRADRAAGVDGPAAFQVALGTQMGGRTSSVVLVVLRFCLPFFEWLFRRRTRDQGLQFRYDAPVRRPMLFAIISSGFAFVILQMILFAASLGWLAWFVSTPVRAVPIFLLMLRAGWVRRPHIVTAREVVLRRGPLFQLTIDLADVLRVQVESRSATCRGGWKPLGGAEFELPVAATTNCTLYLSPGASVRLFDRPQAATVIHFFADQPQDMASRICREPVVDVGQSA